MNWEDRVISAIFIVLIFIGGFGITYSALKPKESDKTDWKEKYKEECRNIKGVPVWNGNHFVCFEKEET